MFVFNERARAGPQEVPPNLELKEPNVPAPLFAVRRPVPVFLNRGQVTGSAGGIGA